MLERLVIPLQRKVSAELYQSADLVVLNKVVGFGDVTDSAFEIR
jgi:hypothetical protein